ncbi:MAG TPA: hypothetical protein VFY02_13685 [Gaiellaceae bacterium]|nr:hypothetical protein [Gaiellaceae bacterium]
MKEQSQIEEMRAAVRGDRERAEQARQRSLENVRTLVEHAPPSAVPPREPQPEPQPDPEPAPAPERRRGLFGLRRRR